MAKEFKPVSPLEQSEEEKSVVKETNYHWSESDTVKNWFGKWKEYVAWLYGDQYTVYLQSSNKLVDLTRYIERETKNVYNRVLPTIRQMLAELRYEHRYYVEPNTFESEDIKAAKVASKYVDYSNENGKLLQKLGMAKLWLLVTGCVYWKEWWDKNLFGLLVNPETGKVTKEQGDMNFSYVNPFNVREDPYGLGRWVIEGAEFPVSFVEAEFDLPEGSLKNDENKSFAIDPFGKKSESYREDSCVRITRLWPKSKKHPKGRMTVQASNWLLWDGGNPNVDAELGYFKFPGILPILGTNDYDSAVRIMQKPQKHFNKYNSVFDQFFENYKTKAMIPRGSLRGKEIEMFTRNNVDYVVYNATSGGNPYWQNPPNPPPMASERQSFMANEIETESSVRKVSLGQLPQYAQRASAKLWEGLKGQDRSVLVIPVLEGIDTEMQKALNFRLKQIQKKYSLNRMVKALGRGEKRRVVVFKGSDLRDNTDVRAKAGVDMFAQKSVKNEAVQLMMEKGMIDDPKEALKLLDVKGIEEYMEEEFIDQNYAERQLETMKNKDVYIKPDENDNHQVMFDAFNDFRKTEEFDVLEDKKKNNIQKKIEEHKNYLEGGGEKEKKREKKREKTEGGPPERAGITDVRPEERAGAARRPARAAGGEEASPEERAMLEAILKRGGR